MPWKGKSMVGTSSKTSAWPERKGGREKGKKNEDGWGTRQRKKKKNPPPFVLLFAPRAHLPVRRDGAPGVTVPGALAHEGVRGGRPGGGEGVGHVAFLEGGREEAGHGSYKWK